VAPVATPAVSRVRIVEQLLTARDPGAASTGESIHASNRSNRPHVRGFLRAAARAAPPRRNTPRVSIILHAARLACTVDRSARGLSASSGLKIGCPLRLKVLAAEIHRSLRAERRRQAVRIDLGKVDGQSPLLRHTGTLRKRV
jgi:hypothetical protein